MNAIRYEKDADNIVHMIFDRPDGSTNIMNEEFQHSLIVFMQQLKEDESVVGVIMRSNKKTFFAGGDLDSIYQTTSEDAEIFFNTVESMKACMRQLESMGIPVVALINGSALGGGWELALCCHYRIALDDKRIKLGLPEVTLGLLPGGGGVIRMTRLLGLEAAMPYVAEGKQFSPQQGLKAGLVHELCQTPSDMIDNARQWIKNNQQSCQPWDSKNYKIPGGTPKQPAFAQMLPVLPSILKSKTKGCLPAPEAILNIAIEGLQVDFDTATRIESRYFTQVVTGQIAKNMIGTLWFQLNEIKAGLKRPQSVAPFKAGKVGILGAGMMGAGIAYACVSKNISVVLKDVSVETAERGKAYSEKLLAKKVARGFINEEEKARILQLIHTTDNSADLKDCDLVIEAVFEDRELKAKVTAEAESQLPESTVFASNTSTLPITGLAQASVRPENFIGLHFFSPVDKMPLVEIICGKQTGQETLAKAFDFVLQIQKTPIIVNDSRSFFTSRVFATYALEGIAMLGEGIAAPSIENAAYLSGFAVGPLAVTDEVTLSLIASIRQQTIKDLEAEGLTYQAHPADAIVDSLLEQNRSGKAAGQGFYDYPESEKKRLWPGLKEQFFQQQAQVPLQDIKDRLLFIQALESLHCLDEQVLTSVRDANVGSIMGFGFPVWTGGVLQFINQYGLRNFIQRSQELAEQYGERFTPPASLVSMADANEYFQDK